MQGAEARRAKRGGVPSSRPAESLTRVRLFEMDFVAADGLEAVITDLLDDQRLQDGKAPIVVTPNVDYVVQLPRSHESVRRAVASANWILPDGQPIVWTSRLVGRLLPARLAGSSLVADMWSDARVRALEIAVIASSPELADAVTTSFSSARVVTAPRFSPGDHDGLAAFVEEHLDALAETRPSLVFVGLGFPKDILLVAALLERWPHSAGQPVFLAVGGSFEMLFGHRRRAPGWMQRWGLEWLFRFVQEPRRLFVRYWLRGPMFLVPVAAEWRRSRRSADHGSAGPGFAAPDDVSEPQFVRAVAGGLPRARLELDVPRFSCDRGAPVRELAHAP